MSDATKVTPTWVADTVTTLRLARPFSPNTSAQAMPTEPSSASASPAPNANDPPLEHSRNRPATTAIWNGRWCRR